MKRVVLSKTFEPSDDPEFLHNDPEFFHDNLDTTEEIISHAFHKASIFILGLLVCYVSNFSYDNKLKRSFFVSV